MEDLPESLLKAYEDPQILAESKKIDLPVQNKFIPTNFDLITSIVGVAPKNILNDEFIELWHKQDNTFKVPKVSLKLCFKNNDCGIGYSPLAQVQAMLWANIFNEYTRELRYLAEKALLNSKLEFNNELTLEVDGFSDSIPNFIKLYMSKLDEFDVQKLKKEFEIQLQKLQKDYKNFFKQPPYLQGHQYNEYLLVTRTFSPKQLLEESQKIDYESFIFFHKNQLQQVRLELYIGGNITSDQALQISNVIKTHVFEKRGAATVLKTKLIDRRVIQPALDQVIVYEETLDEKQNNNYICMNYEVGESQSIRSRVLLEIFSNVFSEQFYTTLRTIEQLGYICWCRTGDQRGVGLIRFIIQSDVQPPQYLASRISNFIQQQKKRLEEFTVEQFETVRNAVEVKIKEKDFSIKKQADRFFQYITQHHYTFDLKEKMLEDLKHVKLSDLQDSFKKIFINNMRCSQTHLVTTKHAEQNSLLSKVTQPQNGYEVVTNPESIKFKCSLHPDYYAYKQ